MSPSPLDSERGELLEGFLVESRELLDDVEPLVVQLEQVSAESGNQAAEILNRVFRLFHSIKGGAGFLDLKSVCRATHAAETLLDLFRKGKATVASSHIDLLNRACDFLRSAFEKVEETGSDGSLSEQADDIAQSIDETIAELTNQPASNEQHASIASTIELPQIESLASDETTGPVFGAGFEINEEMVKTFLVEASEQLEAAETNLLVLENNAADEDAINKAFRAFHSFKGNAGFMGYGDCEHLGHAAEDALEAVRSKQIKPDRRLFNLLLKILDFLKQAIGKVEQGLPADIPAMTGLISLLNATTGNITPTQPPSLESAVIEGEVLELPRRRTGEKDYKAPHQRRAADKELPGGEPEVGDQRGGGDASKQSVRVDIAKLDKLLDLVGELVIAEAMVSHNPDLKELGIPLDRFERASMHLNKITREMQDVVTAVRMIPLAGTLKRMIRLVRDLSQKAGKKIELEIIGEQTEVDKSVIEQITDPLVHIIRNSIDHGISTPEAREKVGKPAIGKLTIEAKYVGGEVWISVTDDGQGLSRDKIIARAQERGLLTGDGSDLRDEQVWAFIFLPGFSTAEKVTEISGRGVGMDVVRRNIEAIRGKVDTYSKPGVGTTITMRIPLTLAIIDGMIARAGRSLFTVPTGDIRISLRPNKEQIVRTPDGKLILNLRGKLLPIVDLPRHFDMSDRDLIMEESILVVVESNLGAVCLGVEELLGQQQVVIKGLSDYVGELPGISGCTILGGGEISLIIDTAGLIASLVKAEAGS